MGEHSRGTRLRVRSALAAVVLTLGGLGAVGTAQAAQTRAELVPGTPCTTAARACVDLTSKQAWLVEEGAVSRGPVPVSPGGPGHETPHGDFRVEWKNANHRSTEFDGAPMPFAVFFAEGGIAFHEGRLDSPSAGCVRLGHEDATYFYDFLHVGDPVQVR
jgi:lipoprotein-anchoring transpeptidase ErfK/SrfK